MTMISLTLVYQSSVKTRLKNKKSGVNQIRRPTGHINASLERICIEMELYQILIV